jgi:subtilase family serine protease
MFRILRLNALLAFIVLLLSSIALMSQTNRRAPALIRESVDETRLVTLGGNTRPEANAENDRGAVSDDLAMNHMLLQLKRSTEVEQAVEKMIAQLHDPQSPNFHKWLTASDFGKSYGLADTDIQAVRGWLESHGFTVSSVYPNGMVIDFSGTAGQVRAAFHTSIHNLSVKGVNHIANFGDPQIPAAVAPAVAGIV